jgi:predicted RNA-binding protein with PUA-like domain
MRHWLMKSEPSAFSIDDLANRASEPWDGVRNYQARNNMRAMEVGDLAFFYHSNADPSGVAGICRISRAAYPDHTAWDPANQHFDPRSTPDRPVWHMVEVQFVEKFPRVVSLAELKETPGLEDMIVTRRSRLSVTPVSEREWHIVTHLAHTPAPAHRSPRRSA